MRWIASGAPVYRVRKPDIPLGPVDSETLS
jgi:hypothetical protein